MKTLSISRFIRGCLLILLLAGLSFVVFHVTKSVRIGSNIYALKADSEDATPAEIQSNIDALVSDGSQAQDRVIEAIKTEKSWDMRIFRYYHVLKQMGEPAHQALLKTIDAEKNPISRFRCIWVLQEAFNDYSKLNVAIYCLTSPSPLNETYLREYNEQYLRLQLQEHFQDGLPPILFTDEQDKITRILTPDFLDWYKGHKTALPKLNLPNSQ